MKGDCNSCANRLLPSYSTTCSECGLLSKNYKPITNADRIRSMSDEELADYLTWHSDTYSRYGMSWIDWLKKKVEQ